MKRVMRNGKIAYSRHQDAEPDGCLITSKDVLAAVVQAQCS
jgi:hypothetical protein